MAPSISLVASLLRLSSADLDEASMLQMPAVEKSVDKDASDCACPGYYEQDCRDNAFQGCIWTDAGHSDSPWCQCDPDFVYTPPLFVDPASPPAPHPPPISTPVFPNPVLLRNADSERLIGAAGGISGRANSEGAQVPPTTRDWPNSVGPTFSWVIEQYQGTDASTICNHYNNRCLYVSDSGAVEATYPPGAIGPDPPYAIITVDTVDPFSDSQLWIIEPTGDGKYTVTHRNSGLRLFADGLERQAEDPGSLGWGASEGASDGGANPDQMWYIEDFADKCAGSLFFQGDASYIASDEWLLGSEAVLCLDIEDCLSHLSLGQCGA